MKKNSGRRHALRTQDPPPARGRTSPPRARTRGASRSASRTASRETTRGASRSASRTASRETTRGASPPKQKSRVRLPGDEESIAAILRAAAGAVTPATKLATLFQCNPDFGQLEWMIAILAIEIELGVEIPESLADDHRQTVSRFAARVAALPRIDSPEYTLDRLSLLAQALLCSEPATPSPQRR